MLDLKIATPYSDFSMMDIPKKGNRPRRVGTLCACAVCHNSRVTLLKREGAYICKPCWERLLLMRELERKAKEKADG